MSLLDLTADTYLQRMPTSKETRSFIGKFTARYDYRYIGLGVVALETAPDVWDITPHPGYEAIPQSEQETADYIFYGSGAYEVSDALATDLTTAGYTVVNEIVFTSPTNWSTVAEPVTITGEALMARPVERVDIRIYSRDRDEYWTGSGWQASPYWFPVPLSEENIINPTWSYVFDSSEGTTIDEYWVPCRVQDVDGNWSEQFYLNFGVA